MYLNPEDHSLIPGSSSSAKPKARMMPQRREGNFKVRKLNDSVVKEDNAMQIEPEGGLVLHKTEPKIKETQKISAKAQLFHICTKRHWKAPEYECCGEDGPSHKKLFTFKVTVGIKEYPHITVVECFGSPQPKKKFAAEKAAEAAVWYLKNMDHILQTEKASVETKPL